MYFHQRLKRQLGLELMRERHKRTLNLATVANKCGFSPRRLEHMELGTTKYSINEYMSLLDFYNKNVRIELKDDSTAQGEQDE